MQYGTDLNLSRRRQRFHAKVRQHNRKQTRQMTSYCPGKHRMRRSNLVRQLWTQASQLNLQRRRQRFQEKEKQHEGLDRVVPPLLSCLFARRPAGLDTGSSPSSPAPVAEEDFFSSPLFV